MRGVFRAVWLAGEILRLSQVIAERLPGFKGKTFIL
jgi:hypothetical protein